MLRAMSERAYPLRGRTVVVGVGGGIAVYKAVDKITKKSVKLFGGNTLDIGKDSAKMLWFPAQARIAAERNAAV